jgi:hypothetical protein
MHNCLTPHARHIRLWRNNRQSLHGVHYFRQQLAYGCALPFHSTPLGFAVGTPLGNLCPRPPIHHGEAVSLFAAIPRINRRFNFLKISEDFTWILHGCGIINEHKIP